MDKEQEIAEQGCAGKSTTEEDKHCLICLLPVGSRAALKCGHDEFCFPCIEQWSHRRKPACPKCRKPFTEIFHNFGDDNSYDTFTVDLDAGYDDLYVEVESYLPPHLLDNSDPTFLDQLVREMHTMRIRKAAAHKQAREEGTCSSSSSDESSN